jgi:hypothetical protein
MLGIHLQPHRVHANPVIARLADERLGIHRATRWLCRSPPFGIRYKKTRSAAGPSFLASSNARAARASAGATAWAVSRKRTERTLAARTGRTTHARRVWDIVFQFPREGKVKLWHKCIASFSGEYPPPASAVITLPNVPKLPKDSCGANECLVSHPVTGPLHVRSRCSDPPTE